MKKVLILLGSYNGEKYIKAQIDSLLKQKNIDLKILISDDGSSDTTMEILKNYQVQLGDEKLSIVSGPKQGFAKNFLSLISLADDNFDYYAFCDQDDIWDKDKIKIAISQLELHDHNTPLLYCSRTRLIDAEGKHIGFSPLFKRKPDFKNALVQSIAGGNTMVFNKKSCQLLKQLKYPASVISHDWWAYLFICACGGHVIYDKCSYISYRQHDSNLIGTNNGFYQKIKRMKLLIDGCFKNWNDSHIECLMQNHLFLNDENKIVLDNFIELRNATIFKKIQLIKKVNVYRQTLLGNLSLLLALLMNKV